MMDDIRVIEAKILDYFRLRPGDDVGAETDSALVRRICFEACIDATVTQGKRAVGHLIRDGKLARIREQPQYIGHGADGERPVFYHLSPKRSKVPAVA